jgi:hypothetical protein
VKDRDDYWLWRCPECGYLITHIPRPHWARMEYVVFERLVECHELFFHGIRAQEVAGL